MWNCLWAFDLGLDKEGKVAKYKARLCFQGSSRREGIDHTWAEIFTHVLRLQSPRILQAVFIQFKPSAGLEMGVEAWDVKTAFVRAIMHKQIYMPPYLLPLHFDPPLLSPAEGAPSAPEL